MEPVTNCFDPPVRGAAPGMPARWLASAWRDAAASGGPAAVLVERDGVLVVGWVNAALGELLEQDVADLAGRSLRELAEAAEDPDPLTLPATGVAPELMAMLPDGAELADGPRQDDRLVLWARLAHELARAEGGSGPATANGHRVHVVVRAVEVPDQDVDCTRHAHPAQVPAPRGADAVRQPGVVTELPAGPGHRCWLLTLEPVHHAVAEAEAALAVAERRFEALASCAPVGILASEAGLRLGYVNEYFVRLTGREAVDLLGNGWLDVIHRDDLPALYTAVQTVLRGVPVELAVRLGVEQGATRWLDLRFAPTTTSGRAAGFIGTAEDVTQRRSWEEHLSYLAHHDPLTGLMNSRRLQDVLAEQLVGRRGRDREFAVLFLDLDGLEAVNDSLGHAEGDKVLVEVARRMRRVARESDIVARSAGEEFVVLLRNITSPAQAEAAARRHLAALAEPVRIGAVEASLKANIGIALPAGHDTPASLLRAADLAMYEAKAAGPGLYRLAPRPSRGRGR